MNPCIFSQNISLINQILFYIIIINSTEKGISKKFIQISIQDRLHKNPSRTIAIKTDTTE